MTWLAAAVATTTLISGYQQGKAVKESTKDQSSQMLANAARREKEGEMDSAEVRRKNRILLGDARAAMAGSGGTTTGSQALLQQGEIAGAGKFNELSYLFEAKLDAQAMRTGAQDVRRSGRSAARATYASTISNVLTSQAGSSLMGRFSDWRANVGTTGVNPAPVSTSIGYVPPARRN